MIYIKILISYYKPHFKNCFEYSIKRRPVLHISIPLFPCWQLVAVEPFMQKDNLKCLLCAAGLVFIEL